MNVIVVLVGLRILNICFLYVLVLVKIFLWVNGLCVMFLFVGLLIILVKLLIKKIILWFRFWKVFILLIRIVWFKCRLGVVGLKFVLILSFLFDFSFLINLFLINIFFVLCFILVRVVCKFIVYYFKNLVIGVWWFVRVIIIELKILKFS